MCTILKKRMNLKKCTKDEIYLVVKDISDESLIDIELFAFITSSCINDLSYYETEYLARAMICKGDKVEVKTHNIVDKHSIGGVPVNKIFLPVVAIVAANKLTIPKTVKNCDGIPNRRRATGHGVKS
ncbi:MAG: hypothetical protein ACT6FE_02805 [Methanosarcinaceae archaeon]